MMTNDKWIDEEWLRMNANERWWLMSVDDSDEPENIWRKRPRDLIYFIANFIIIDFSFILFLNIYGIYKILQ